MITATETGPARLLAACDLLAEPIPHLDAYAITRVTAELVARLTASDLGAVAVEGPEGSVVGSYPRRVGTVASSLLLERATGHPWSVLDGSDLADLVGHDLDILAVGFEAAGRYRGVVMTVDPVRGAFGAIDEWLLVVTARRVAAQFEVVALHHDRLVDQQLANDARLAGEVQREMLASGTDAPGLDIAGLSRPARHVGGDLFGWHSDDRGTIVTVADVSGKGAAAALLMASIQASVRQAFVSGVAGPAELIDRVRAETGPLLERTSRIVTMAAVAFDLGGGTTVASAGHSPVVVRSGGRAELILPDSVPLGVPAGPASERTHLLATGDVVVVGTDGLIDQRDRSGTAYGVDRLLAAIDQAGGESRGMAERLLESVATFAGDSPQEDDQALVVVTRGGRS